MDADENETTFAQVMLKNVPPLRVALSVERPGMQHADLMTARCYYHAVRFIRLMRHMETYRVPLWLSDVDALANRDLSGMFTRLNGADLSMRVRPGRIEPWNQFNASVVGVGTTAAAADYIRTIAAYVAHFHQARTLRWGIDQLAMYGVYADLKDRGTPPALALLGDREVDYEYNDDGYIWCNSGTGKLQHLKRVADPGSAVGKPAPGRGKFYNVFERYWEETRTVAARIGLPI